MIERGEQSEPSRVEHAVAEHVSGHVADPDDRERVLGGIDAQLAEVPLHRLPDAARGDAERLVVVPWEPPDAKASPSQKP